MVSMTQLNIIFQIGQKQKRTKNGF